MAINFSIFLPRNTIWYQGLAKQLKNAGAKFNITTYCGLLDEAELLAWIVNHDTHIILEMNRPRNDIPYLPSNIIHICWVVDFNGRPISDFQGSELTYLFGPKWLEKYHGSSFFRWFGPGVCLSNYYPDDTPFLSRAAFAGHIPLPWSDEELLRTITKPTNKPVTFGEFLPELELALLKNRNNLKVHDDYVDLIANMLLTQHGTEMELDRKLEYDMTGRLIRLLNRTQLIDSIIDVIDCFDIYGPLNWLSWPKYKPYYKKYLTLSSEMRNIYAASLNLHEGNGMHFRVLDCMASAGLIFVKKGEYDEKAGGIKTFFLPDKHYVEFDLDDLNDKLNFYLFNQKAADKIRFCAAEEVKKNHTWCKRFESIFEDLKQLGYLSCMDYKSLQ